MSPEYLSGNMWRLNENECITGRITGGEHTLHGPQILRVHEYPDLGEEGMMSIQGDKTIELDGLDFPALVEQF